MRPAWLAIGVLGALAAGCRGPAGAEPRAAAAGLRLRVMTYNCGSGTFLDLSHFGISRIAEEIIDNRADLVGLTEIDVGTDWYGGRDLVAELRTALAARGFAMDCFQSRVVSYHGGWQVHALFSRWPIRDPQSREISAKRCWNVDRITVEPSPGLLFDCYQNHVPLQLDGRFEGLGRCWSYVNESRHPRAFIGDFNFGYDSREMRSALDAGLVHAGKAALGGPCLSVGPAAATVGPLPLVAEIDHVFTAGLVRVIRCWTHFTTMSDHWPVIAELELDVPYGSPVSGDNVRVPKPSMPWDDAMDAWRSGDLTLASVRFHALRRAAPDGERADYYLYAAGSMDLLRGSREEAEAAFREAAVAAPPRYWDVRSLERLALLLADGGRPGEAAEWAERWLDGYYELVHDYPLDEALAMTLPRMASWRSADGKPTTPDRLLSELLARHADRPLARACHYLLSRPRLAAQDYAMWYRDFKAARIDLDTLFPRTDWQIDILNALAAAGDDRTDGFLRKRIVPAVPNPENLRNVLGRYWPLRHPEDYEVHVAPGRPATVALEGERHVVLDPGVSKDLRGGLELSVEGDALRLCVRVYDPLHFNDAAGADLWRGDSLQVAIDPGGNGAVEPGEDVSEFGAALTASGVASYVWKRGAHADPGRVKALVTREGDETCYDLTLPFDALGLPDPSRPRLGMTLVVSDNDGKGRTGRLEWTPGIAGDKSPAMFPRVWVERAGTSPPGREPR